MAIVTSETRDEIVRLANKGMDPEQIAIRLDEQGTALDPWTIERVLEEQG